MPDTAAPALKVVTIAETSPGVWRLAFDGRALGDSRGYDRTRAIAAARERVAEDERDAIRYARPVILRLGDVA